MMSQTVWGLLSVQDFFKDYNWCGQLLSLEVTECDQDALEEPSWLCLSVQEFLNQSNWRGETLVKQSESPTLEPVSLSLILPVGEFFRVAAWKGKTQATAIPAPPPKLEPTAEASSDSEFNLTDLSELF